MSQTQTCLICSTELRGNSYVQLKLKTYWFKSAITNINNISKGTAISNQLEMYRSSWFKLFFFEKKNRE